MLSGVLFLNLIVDLKDGFPVSLQLLVYNYVLLNFISDYLGFYFCNFVILIM